MTPKALSREIKFRAWNPSTKTYGYFEPFKRFELSAEPDYDGYMGKINTWRYKKGAMGDMGMYYEFSISHENVDDLVFQQYTGLHDKNGKEIYEGDIITWNNQIYTIKWSDDEALFGFYGLNYKDSINEIFEYGSPLWEVGHSAEIIGNIYENPELTIKPFLNNYESTK